MELRAALDLIGAELLRIGLLLEHDKQLPSATTLLAGGPIQGSWWGPPHGERIYAVLEEFLKGEGALCVKLVNGKRTYVQRALWPAFLTLVRDREAERISALSPLARSLREQVLDAGTARADSLVTARFARPQELTQAGGELETALLLYVTSLHTESGAHTKIYQAWPVWAKANAVTVKAPTLQAARGELAAAVERLAANVPGRHKLKIPLL